VPEIPESEDEVAVPEDPESDDPLSHSGPVGDESRARSLQLPRSSPVSSPAPLLGSSSSGVRRSLSPSRYVAPTPTAFTFSADDLVPADPSTLNQPVRGFARDDFGLPIPRDSSFGRMRMFRAPQENYPADETGERLYARRFVINALFVTAERFAYHLAGPAFVQEYLRGRDPLRLDQIPSMADTASTAIHRQFPVAVPGVSGERYWNATRESLGEHLPEFVKFVCGLSAREGGVQETGDLLEMDPQGFVVGEMADLLRDLPRDEESYAELNRRAGVRLHFLVFSSLR
jgi:hypothetical protein